MEISTLLWIIVAAIAVCVALSAKTGMNIGLPGFVFAYLIGVFVLGQSSKALAANFPTALFMQMMFIPAFFYVGVQNKTLVLFGNKMLYAFRNKPIMIPFAFLLIGLAMGLLGSGCVTNNIVLTVMCFTVGLEMGLNPYLLIVTIVFGSNLGTWFPWSGYGVVVSKMMDGMVAGIGNEVCYKMELAWGIAAMVYWAILFVLTKGYRVKATTIEKPEAYNKEQKMTLGLIAVFVLCLLIPAIGSALGIKVLGTISKKCSADILAPFFIFAAILMKLVGHKEIVNKGIPWATCFMVAGINTLLNIATNNGVTDYIGAFLSSSITSVPLMCACLSLLGSLLSCFAGAIMTVTPMLSAIAVPFAASLGISPVPLIISIMVGASCTAISPMSSGGAMMISNVPNEQLREGLFNKCLLLAVIGFALSAALAYVVWPIIL